MVPLGDLEEGERFALSPAGRTREVVEAASSTGGDPVVFRLRDSQTTSFARTTPVY